MRGGSNTVCGCFPTGRHYPGIADRIAKTIVKVEGLAEELAADAVWMHAKLAIIDFETTGFSAENDRVIEMGVVSFENGALGEKHNFLINPEMPVPPDSTKVHGITDEMLADKPTFKECFKEIVACLEGHIPVAYNAGFDKKFLVAEYARLSKVKNPPPALRQDVTWIDPLVWVRELQKYEKSKKLGDVAKRMGVDLENAHRATDDAAATGLVLMKLAKDMPDTYGELIRIQTQYAAQQEAQMAAWRARRGS